MGIATIPLINAGAELFGQAANAVIQGQNNRASRQFAWNMYAQQRKDALSDWTMQNEYNSPTSQMARLREAGLNPNLVYGNGATTTGGAVRSSSAPSWNPTPPQFNAKSILGSYYDTQIRQAQIDNLKTQNTVMVQDALLKAAQIASLGANTARSQFKLDFEKELREISAEAARLGVLKQKADIDYTLDQNERAQAQNAQSLREGAERILNMRASRANTYQEREKIIQEIKNLKEDEKIKALDRQLREKGIYPGDPAWWRALGRVVSNIPETGEIINAHKAGSKAAAATPMAQMGLDWWDLFH